MCCLSTDCYQLHIYTLSLLEANRNVNSTVLLSKMGVVLGVAYTMWAQIGVWLPVLDLGSEKYVCSYIWHLPPHYDDDPGISKHQASASLELSEEESVWKEPGDDISEFNYGYPTPAMAFTTTTLLMIQVYLSTKQVHH